MSYNPKPDFDAYITSSQYRKDTLEVKCKECSHVFYVKGAWEYGSFDADNEEDWICPACEYNMQGEA